MKSLLGQTRWRLSLVVALTLCTILSSGCIQHNSYPVISSLQSEKDSVTHSGSCEVECVASDADGDSLTYAWSATAGTFSGTGPITTWMAPDIPGTYAITVKVTDSRGGEATMQLTVDVLANHPPVIESLTAEPSLVRQGKTSTIECVASDPDSDELSYLWSAATGNISGQGSAVTWTAHNTCGTYVITVTVSDSRGGEASEELDITVRKPG